MLLMCVIQLLMTLLMPVELADKNTINPDIIEQLKKDFDRNPTNVESTVKLLDLLSKDPSMSPMKDSVVNIYFRNQKTSDYIKPYNWNIIKKHVDNVSDPIFKYLYENRNSFTEHYSQDDVYQKLDNVMVSALGPLFSSQSGGFDQRIDKLKADGYQHADIVADYFRIENLKTKKTSEDFFYVARKLFRYFPEDRVMIKRITADALDIMDEVRYLKVIHLWAGKTVEKDDLEAIYNYTIISYRCGYLDVAKNYLAKGMRLATNQTNTIWKSRYSSLKTMLKL